MRNMHLFDPKTLRPVAAKTRKPVTTSTGDYFGLPWPCYGNPSLKHPGSPNLYDTSKHVMDGGGNFRANFGVEKRRVRTCWPATVRHSLGADMQFGYPEFDHVLLKKLGWWDELTDDEKKKAEGKNWKTDPSGGIIRVAMKNHGCHPFGNAKARAVVWNFPDAMPQHREPLFSQRVPIWSPSTRRTRTRRPSGACPRCTRACRTSSPTMCGEGLPLIMTSGRLVEYEGGGDETRSNPWLAELQQDMFVEINPRGSQHRGIATRTWCG
jgi:formate dehydrogenase major subunit